MKKYLIFDSETTGLIDFKADIMEPHQPRIIQIAAVLCDEEGNHLEEMDATIKPDGWIVPDAITALNGFTTALCEEKGIPMKEALTRFNELKAMCTDRVAFNISYDKRLLAKEAQIYGIPHSSEGIVSHCVMLLAQPICKLPPTGKMMASGRKGFKTPKLTEAYEFFFQKKFDNAHNAAADVIATKEIFFKIINHAAIETPAITQKETSNETDANSAF